MWSQAVEWRATWPSAQDVRRRELSRFGQFGALWLTSGLVLATLAGANARALFTGVV
ncbi:MAG: hypothetical protein J6386_20825 [Candidatus Synoicihabitans palmerolidicus]|nr:hypothetical protein [Candidatus Synoicihabitans palmerolidicus]